MPNGLMNLALGLAMQVGNPGPSEAPNAPVPVRAYGQYGFSGSAEQYHPSDSQMNWVHGYHQEISAYGGHPVYRPYNYKDVLSQSQTAAGWGERPAMPYSQQFWHKYHDQATMLKMSRNQNQMAPMPFAQGQPTMPQNMGWTMQPTGIVAPNQQVYWQQSPVPAVQNTITVPTTDSLQPPPIQTTGEFNQINYRR